MTINCVFPGPDQLEGQERGGGGGQAAAGDVDRMFAVTLYRVPPPQPQPSLAGVTYPGSELGGTETEAEHST